VQPTRRRILHAALLSRLFPAVPAAARDFWKEKDPAAWTPEEKDALLYQSPWARQGTLLFTREIKHEPPPTVATPGAGVPGARPANTPRTGTPTVPMGEPIPPPPGSGKGEPPKFPVLVRWETARPVQLAGGAKLPEETSAYYVIRLKGMPLMRPRPGKDEPNPNLGLLEAIKQDSLIQRKNRDPLRCNHLLTGSGNEVTDLLLFFPRQPDPITLAENEVEFITAFGSFRLSLKFPLKEMVFQGALML